MDKIPRDFNQSLGELTSIKWFESLSNHSLVQSQSNSSQNYFNDECT